MPPSGKKVYGPTPKGFHPTNPKKYKGKIPIITRSKLEIEFAQWLDRHSNCVAWGCESAVVKYQDPAQNNKVRRYIIDFTATFKTASGKLQTYYIEIKPSRQTVPPKPSARKKEKTFLKEQALYATNSAKWKAASEMAKRKGYKFIIVTEKDIHK